MDPRTADQPSLQVSCPARESQHQNPGAMQQTDEQAVAQPQPDIQTVVADTGCAEIHRVPSEQDDNHPSDEDCVQESEALTPGPISTSPEQPQDASSEDNTTPRISNSQSAHHQMNQTDDSASMMPAHSNSSSPSGSISLNAEMQHPQALRLSESLGWEGLAGILGGFFGLLGVFGFLVFLWFGCKQSRSPILKLPIREFQSIFLLFSLVK